MPSNRITIVMYHYVRPLADTRYPALKGLDLTQFRGQLAYIRKHYTPIAMEDLIESGARSLPPKSILLTFDDGYLDHFRYVLPLLMEAKIRGAFFPPARVVRQRKVLDVNKIHFVLASADAHRVVEELEGHLSKYPGLNLAEYRGLYWAASRYDPPEVIYVKRLLQHALPRDIRSAITDSLFQKFVTGDEPGFAEELYMTADQLRAMAASGMHIGSHGESHEWLDKMSAEEQGTDIERSLELLDEIGVPRQHFTFCYPYGAYDQATLEVLSRRGCRAAVTTNVDIADLERDPLLELPRLDTNDLPKNGNAPIASWTARALQA